MQWRTISGYEGLYEVSEYGDVRSLDRMELQPARIRNGKEIAPFYRKRKGQHIKSKQFPAGYFLVELNNNGALNFLLHRLVYKAFVGNVVNGNIVHHIDGNKTNNHYSNLEQMSFFEHNRIHAHPPWNKGIPNSQETLKKSKHTRAKNHLPKCKEAYDLQKQGFTLLQIAEKLGIASGSASGRIQKYKKHIGENKKWHITDMYREGNIPEGIHKFDCAVCKGVFFSKVAEPRTCWSCGTNLWRTGISKINRKENHR